MKTEHLFRLDQRGQGVPQAAFFVILIAGVLLLYLMAAPIGVQKQGLDTYANELCRTAECSGRVGKETTKRAHELSQQTGLSPEITWSQTGNIQIGNTVTVTLKVNYDMKFGSLGTYGVPLTSMASGKSEVYWK